MNRARETLPADSAEVNVSTAKQKSKRIDPVDGTRPAPDATGQAGEELPAALSETLEAEPGWLAKFLHNWQELLVWKPILLGLLIGLWLGIPSLDPKSGIDGFGDTFHLVLRALFVSALFFGTWLVKSTYFRELPAHEEQALWLRIQADRPVLALILDRLETLVILCVIAYILLH